MKTDFEYIADQEYEKRKQKQFEELYNPDTPGFSLRFYVFLTVGFALVIATVLWFAPSIDHNPIFALLALIFISVGLWFAIDRSAKRNAEMHRLKAQAQQLKDQFGDLDCDADML